MTAKEDFVEFEDEYENDEIEQLGKDIGEFNSFSFGYNIATMIDYIDKGIIDLKPEFQREFVWDVKRASRLIESILLGIPIPNVILGQNKKSQNYIVIDGQQRLKTIFFYIHSGKFKDERGERDFKLNLKIDDDSISKKWNDRSFIELDSIDRLRIKNYILNATVIQYEGDKPNVVRELYERLNTGGVRLLAQEIRQCIFEGDFNDKLKVLNNYNNWRLLFGRKAIDKRMNDIEVILRFYSLYRKKFLKYNEPMKGWLDSAMNKGRTPMDFTEFENLFKLTMDKIIETIGVSAFKKDNKSFNRAIFDAIAVAVSMGIFEKKLKHDLVEGYRKLLLEDDFMDSIREGTTGKSKVKKRIDLAIKKLTEINLSDINS
ncbi:MAG: DUF262 domain-containing protein [archaeon]